MQLFISMKFKNLWW